MSSSFDLDLGRARFGVLVHGGAGNVSPAGHARHIEGCARAAAVARAVLEAGGRALDAVEIAVRALEDDPSFNAGTGASLNAEGHVEHDASIMDGEGLAAGAVCTMRGFANPIAVARAVLEDGRHVLYAGVGARDFALARGFAEVDEARLVTDAARAALERARSAGEASGWAGGTVGAVARDAAGHVAAATSTGGTVNKAVGRVGDSPILGAGCYADDLSGAVSTTGHGEGMMRLVVAKAIADALGRGELPSDAVRTVLAALETRLGSTGGAIAIRHDGRFGLARTTATMSWSWSSDAGERSGI